MEEYYYLIDVLERLIEKGYSVNFSLLGETFKELHEGTHATMLPKDFKVDEVYKCKDNRYDSYFVFVFAVSSGRYNFKGILINALEEQAVSPLRNKLQDLVHSLKTILFRKPSSKK